jgi:hypothetical protein
VRRVEHRLLVEGDVGSLYGLLGSFGVVAACLGHNSTRITHEHTGRLCVVDGGVLLPGVNAPVPGGRSTLVFEPRLVHENPPMAPIDGLQTAMREGEARLAEGLGDEAEMVVLDGPLTFLGSSTAPIVGLVKRLIRSYLAAPEGGLLRRLEVGTRTPLFLIPDARAPRYSWASPRWFPQSPKTQVVSRVCITYVL